MSEPIKTISTIAVVATALMATPVSKNIQNKALSTIMPSNMTQTVQTETNNQESIYENSINVENVWAQPLFNIGFNNDNTFKVTKGWSEINPYSHEAFTLTITNESREVLQNLSFQGGFHPEDEVFDKLNGFKFSMGDIITMSSGTGTEYFINNGEKQTGSVTYKITQNGLVQITAKAENVMALYDGNDKVEISCTVKPNIQVDFVINGKNYTEISNEQGLVTTVVDGNYGDTVYIYPQGELESQVKVAYNKKDFILQGQNIQVSNVWKQGLFSIGFGYNNTLIVKGSWAETNPYYTGNDSLTVQLLNSKGEQIYGEVFKGGVTPADAIAKLLNGKSFEYGDLIHIDSNSGAHVAVGNNSYKGDMYFQLNKKGITYLQGINNSYKALYNGKNTVVTGVISPNSTITAVANGKSYTTSSNSNGDFKITLPNTITSGQNIQLINSNGVSQIIKVTCNTSSFAILNSEIKVINGWGSDAINIKFNPETMQINTSGWNQYLGKDTTNPFIDFGVYDGTTGNKIKDVMFKGNDSTSVLETAINNLSFKFGDIIAISYNNSQGNVQIYNGASSVGNTTGAIEYFKVTQNGLVKYVNPTTIDPLNVLTSNAINTLNVQGKTIANKKITINVSGAAFTGTSDSNGNFNISVSSQKPFTNTTAINVKVAGEIAQTIYPSPANMLESNSGIYFAGKSNEFGKIVFNPITMKMQWLAPGVSTTVANDNPTTYNPNLVPTNLGEVINSGTKDKVLGIVVKSQNGDVLLNQSFIGTSTLQNIYNAVNNVSFKYGDTIEIYQNAGSIGVNVFSNGNIVAPDATYITLTITPQGLVDGIKSQTVYNQPFTVADYYAMKGRVTTGITASGWDDGSQKLAENMVMNQAMQDKVNNAIKDATTDVEKAKAIFEIVSPVPYKNVGGNTINTYENGGVCFNKSQLFAVMGQYAGLVTRVVTGYVNEPSNYQQYTGYHSWNQVWIPSQNEWMTIDTTWHIFDCNQYVNANRHSFSVQATLWNPDNSYTSYFANDPAKAWEHTGEVWNHAIYYNFNLGNDIQFRNLFNDITPSQIKVYNGANSNAAIITFDGVNQTFNVQGSAATLGANTSDNFMTIALVDPTTGQSIFSETLKGDNSVADLRNDLNNKHYNIGDVLEISYVSNQDSHIDVIANGKVISNGNGNMQMFKITDQGLVPFSFNKTITAKATAITGVNNEPFYNTTVSGVGLADKAVTISINGTNFETKSNENGEYSIDIETKAPMTEETNIVVSQWGINDTVVKPIVTKKVELEDSQIVINNVWNYHLGTLGFNTETMTLKEDKGWYMTNPYLSSSAEAFSIGLKSSNGVSLASLIANGSDAIPTPLYEEFNGKSFKYGDSINIDYKTSARIILNNVYVDGQLVNNYRVTKPITLYIAQGGLTTEKPNL
ncbi:MAG: transglutaminase domain-containing protein [Sarcina sp.]